MTTRVSAATSIQAMGPATAQSAAPQPSVAPIAVHDRTAEDPTPKLVITVGLPGSGKTTRARAWVADSPATRKRVNRDDLTRMMIDGWSFAPEHQAALRLLQHAAVRALLRSGLAVVCDDTNLLPEYRQPLKAIARECGVPLEVWDLTDTPLSVCVARDAERARRGGHQVGPDVIRSMHEQFFAAQADAPSGRAAHERPAP